jgi:NIMA (never in mitosis gene a)-related kinase
MDRYQTVKTIGKGSFGCCLLVKHKVTGAQLVLKQIPLPTKRDEQEDCLQEATLMTRLNHANVVGADDVFITKGHLCIVMEYASGGDLEKVMKRHKARNAAMAEAVIVDIISQLALALEYLHSRKHPVLHRDIKAANVFLTPVDSSAASDAPAAPKSQSQFTVKLGDFGVSRVLEQSRMLADTTCGTPFFMAPELYKGVPYGAAADVWSLGVLAYELMSQKLPFSANSMAQLGDAVGLGMYKLKSVDTHGLLKRLVSTSFNL